MGIGIIPFNHSSWYLYFSECPKTLATSPTLEGWDEGNSHHASMVLKYQTNPDDPTIQLSTVFNCGTTDWARVLTDSNAASHTIVDQITRNVVYTLAHIQLSPVAVHQYYAVEADGKSRRYFYSPYTNYTDGWHIDGVAFFAWQTEQPGTIPIYQYHAELADGGENYFYSPYVNYSDGWTLDGAVFFALPEEGMGNVPIYQYHAVLNDGWRYFYSVYSDDRRGWHRDGIVFSALNP